MFVSGAPLRAPGPGGEQQVDKSFMLWFNAHWLPQPLELPENDWVQTGEVVLSTDPDLPVGTRIKAGDRTLPRPPLGRRLPPGRDQGRLDPQGRATIPSSAGEASRSLRGTTRTV